MQKSAIKQISRWEMQGISGAVIFESLYASGLLERLGFSHEEVPHLILLLFVAFALLRAYLQAKAPRE